MSYVPGYSERFIAFLERRAAATHAPELLALLRPGMRLLDCGCGPGTITAGLARRVAPGDLVAIDRAEHQVALTHRRAREEGLTNVLAEVGDVGEAHALRFPDDSFDVVHGHALLEHLADPVAALVEMRRVLRPGGLLGVAVPDLGGFVLSPSEPGADDAFAYYVRLRTAHGDPLAGRHLGGHLEAAGFEAITLTARYELHDPRQPLAHHIADRVAASPATDAGAWVASPEAAEAMAQALRDWADRPVGLFAQCWVAAVASSSPSAGGA